MSMRWSEIEKDKEFLSLPSDQRAIVQREWFDHAVAPNIAVQDRDTAREAFFAEFQHGNQDPAYGQSTMEGMGASAKAGFETGLTQTFVTGPGAILEGVGFKDNLLLKAGQGIEADIQAANPVSRENQQKFLPQAAGAVGQALSMALTIPLGGGGGAAFKELSLAQKALRIGLTGGTAGAASGLQTADELNITDPNARRAMTFGFGVIEPASEMLFGGELAVSRGLGSLLRGKAPVIRPMSMAVAGLGEGIEEIVAGVPERALAAALSQQDPNHPTGWMQPGQTVEGVPIDAPLNPHTLWNEFSLGATAGVVMNAAHRAIHLMTPQERLDAKNAAAAPESKRDELRRKLAAVTQREREAVKMAQGAGLGQNTVDAIQAAMAVERVGTIQAAQKETDETFADGWQGRQDVGFKEDTGILEHTGEDHTSWFKDGAWWKVQEDENGNPMEDANGQPVMVQDPDTSLDKKRDEFIKKGEAGMPEGLQFIKTAPVKPADVTESGQPPIEPATEQDHLTAYNAALRVQPRTITERIAARDGAGAEDNILYRPDRAYRFIGEEGLADFEKSGVIRARQGTKQGYEDAYFMRGQSSSRYAAKYMIEVPMQGEWKGGPDAKYVRPPSQLTRDAPHRIFERQTDGTYKVIADTIGDQALLTTPAKAPATNEAPTSAEAPATLPPAPTPITIDPTTGKVAEPTAAASASPQKTQDQISSDYVAHVTSELKKSGIEVEGVKVNGENVELEVSKMIDGVKVPGRISRSINPERIYLSKVEAGLSGDVPEGGRASARPKSGMGLVSALYPAEAAFAKSNGLKVKTNAWSPVTQAAFNKHYGEAGFDIAGKAGSTRKLTATHSGSIEAAGAPQIQESPQVSHGTPADEAARVAEAYPNSPELAQRVAAAESPAAVQVLLTENEPKAQLVEELSALAPIELADRMREAGADEVEVAEATEGNFDPKGAAEVISGAKAGAVVGEEVTRDNLPVGSVIRSEVYPHESDIIITGPGVMTKRGLEYPAHFTGTHRPGTVSPNEITSFSLPSKESSPEKEGEIIAATPENQGEAPDTSRTQPDEFEARLRQTIIADNLRGWTDVDVQAAVAYHQSRETGALPSDVKRRVVGRVELGMQTPAERAAQEAQERAEVARTMKGVKDDIRQARETTDPIKSTDPDLVKWADGVIEEGELNFGLNPRLLAAHAVRAADWIKTNGLNFAKWSGEQISRFGQGIRDYLRRIWDAGRALLLADNALPEVLTGEPEPVRLPAYDDGDTEIERADSPASPPPVAERRRDAVQRLLDRTAETQGAKVELHRNDEQPDISVRSNAAGELTVEVHEDFAEILTRLTPTRKAEMVAKYRAAIALQAAFHTLANDPTADVPVAFGSTLTGQQQIARAIYDTLRQGYNESAEAKGLWTAALEVARERPYDNGRQRAYDLGQLTWELGRDPQVAVEWVNHLLRLASERQTGKLAEDRGGVFLGNKLWKDRVHRVLDKFNDRAREGGYGKTLKLLLDAAETNLGQSAVEAARAVVEDALLERQIRREAEQEIHPISSYDVMRRRGSNPYAEGVHQAAEAIQREMRERGDRSIRFVRNALGARHLPEIVNGAPFAVESTGTKVIVTDQVHVTLNDRRSAQKNDTSAAMQALRRVMAQAENAANDVRRDNRMKLARAMVGDVIADMQATADWPVFVNDLWDHYRFQLEQMVRESTTEQRAVNAGAQGFILDPDSRATRTRDRDQAAVAWLTENFGPQIAQVIAGEQGIALNMTPGFDAPSTNFFAPDMDAEGRLALFAKNTERFVKTSLAPYMRNTAIRFSKSAEEQEESDEKKTEKVKVKRPRNLAVGVSKKSATTMKGIAKKYLPNAEGAWDGTRDELNAYLRGNEKFKRSWINEWLYAEDENGVTRASQGKTMQDAEESYENMIEAGLDGVEGFTRDFRTYLILDQIAVTEEDGSELMAVRRVLIHENAHDVVEYMRDISPEVNEKWENYRDEASEAELDELVKSGYSWLSGWRESKSTKDRIFHEWIAKKTADIEWRGMPSADSLFGRILNWWRGVVRKLMGTDLAPSDQALLDFMDAGREAMFRSMGEPGGGYANADGDVPVRRAIELRASSNWTGAPLDSFTREGQILGRPVELPGSVQENKPIRDYARQQMGALYDDPVELSAENTANAYRLEHDMLGGGDFFSRYKEGFKTWDRIQRPDAPPHGGDAAVGMLQLELLDYASRLAADTGDSKLLASLLPVANSMLVGDENNATIAGRTLQIRSAAVYKDNLYSFLKATLDAATRAAAGTKQGILRTLGDAIAKFDEGTGKVTELGELGASVDPSLNKDLQEPIVEGITDSLTPAEGAALEKNVEDYEVEGWRERARAAMAEHMAAKDRELETVLRKLDQLLQIKKMLDAKGGSQIKPSMQEDFAAYSQDPEALQREIDALMKKAQELLSELTAQDTSHETKAKRKKRTGDPRVARARKALTADEQGKKLIERYENRNQSVKRVKPPWLQTYEKQIKEPVAEDEFLASVMGEGVSEETANRLLEIATEVRAERRARVKIADEDAMLERATTAPTGTPKKQAPRANYKRIINAIARQVAATPLSQQGDPAWVKQAFVKAFEGMGFPTDVATRYAEKLAHKHDQLLRAGQEKAAMKAAKALEVKEPTPKVIQKAIRSGAFDPLNPNPIIRGLAEKAGYKALSQADFQALAKLDQEINTSLPTLAAEAQTKMARILAKVRPGKTWQDVGAQLFTNGALSSLGVFGLNWLHAAYVLPRKMVTDLTAILGDTALGNGDRTQNILMMRHVFTNLIKAHENFVNEARFSLKNDAYSNRMLEALSAAHSLHTELMAALDDVENWKTNPGAALAGVTKAVWLSSDWVRRILSSADQTWGSVIQEFVLRNEAMRMMVQDSGMTVEAAALIIRRAAEEGALKRTDAVTAGMEPYKAALHGRDVMRQSLAQGLDHHMTWDRSDASKRPSLLWLTTAQKESEMELGNRKGEASWVWDFPNKFLEGFKWGAASFRRVSELLGRPLTGFVNVGANLLNRSFYFSPLGLLRVANKKLVNREEAKRIYSETMATDAQVRMRMYEGIAGTVALLVLELFRWRPEDKEWGIQITGNGPSTPGLKEAWADDGNQKGHIQLMDGDGNVRFAISYTRGGFDHLAIPLTFAGAHSDMDLEGKRASAKNTDWAWAYAQTAGRNVIGQAQFFGAKALFNAYPTSTKPNAIAGWLGYNLQPFTPWGGMTRSITKMLTGPQDESSWRSAIASNLVVAQLFHKPGPALNSLGDQIGNHPGKGSQVAAQRAETAGVPFFIALDPTAENDQIYGFLMRRGVSPGMPMRSALEAKNGFIEDDAWAEYVKTRGAILKSSILRRMDAMERMDGKDVQAEIEKISTAATLSTKRKLGLE